MPMPSLFKYFAVVGSVLFGLLLLANHMFGPAESAKVAALVQPKLVVKHDPHASAVERWRNEQAALKAATQTQTAENASLATKSEPIPPHKAGMTAPVQAAASIETPKVEPVKLEVAKPEAAKPEVKPEPAALQTVDASSIQGEPTDEERAAEAKLAKAKAAKLRKAKLARERAKAEQQAAMNGNTAPGGFFGQTRERTASNQQDAYYYGQRGGQRTAQGPANAYAPQPSFGPFGFGRGW